MGYSKQQIKEIAEAVREHLNLLSPIKPEEAAKVLQGEVTYKPMTSDMEAMIKRKGDSFEIIIDPDKPENRKRFSIAHELGHLFLHMGFLIDADRWECEDEFRDSVFYRQGYTKEEYEANEFAACFLMPESEFEKVAKGNMLNGKYYIEPIAKHFGVSNEAAINRGKWLGLFDRRS